MILIALGVIAIIAVIIIAVRLTRRELRPPGLHRRRDALAAWADDGYIGDDTIAAGVSYGYVGAPADDEDEQYTQLLATMERPAEIAREPEPAPEVPHEEYLPAATTALDDLMAVPEADAPVSPRRVPGRVLRSLRPGRAHAERLELPPMLAPAAGVAAALTAMAQQVAANEHREVARLRAANQELRTEVELLKAEAAYPDLGRGVWREWENTDQFALDIAALEKKLASEAVPA